MGGTGIFFLGILGGMIALPILRALFRREKRVPVVLGSSVPLAPHTIDFSRRYSISAGSPYYEDYGGGGPLKEFKEVRIIGYVEDGKQARNGLYGDWIVAELPDGRKLYLTPQSIRFMEESDIKPGSGSGLDWA